MRLKAGINDAYILILNPIFCSSLGFEAFNTFLLTIPEDQNTNRSKCKTFWKKKVSGM